MLRSFEGQTRSRPTINLGGGSSSSSASTSLDPAERARRERQGRDEHRRQDRAARKVQGWWRSRRSAQATRDQLRKTWDAIDLSTSNVSDAVPYTALLAAFFTPSNKADVARLAIWSRTMAVGKPQIYLFQVFHQAATTSTDVLTRWCFIVKRIASILLKQAPTLPSVPLFLELVRQLLDPAKYKDLGLPATYQDFPAQLAESLIQKGAFQDIRKHVLAFPLNSKPLPISAGPSMAIALSLVSRLQNTPSYHTALSLFTQNILSIPSLASSARLPNPSLNTLTSSSGNLPYFDILAQIAEAHNKGNSSQAIGSAYLLANLLNIGKNRIISSVQAAAKSASTTAAQPVPLTSKDLVALLAGLQACLASVPSEILANSSTSFDGKGKSRETAIEIPSTEIDDLGDIRMSDAGAGGSVSSASTARLDPATYTSIKTLISETFLSSLISLSTRFSASSRPALSSFLVTLLHRWSSERDHIINTLVYSGLVGAGKGLLREIWRGWIRSSALAKAISSSDSKTGSSATNTILNSLQDPRYAAEWPHVILLAELYTRCLLTLGDDEFFSSASAGGAGPNAAAVNSRNPLTIDEVIGLSSLFRNIAFALYWQPEVLKNAKTGADNKVAGTPVTLEALRKLSTRLLQVIHARDSRRQFTPNNHWIMTSQMDLQSFIESAILEDQAIDNDNDSRMPSQAGGEDSDDEDLPRPHATLRRNLPSRRQMAYLSPRLGVLNNIPFVIPFETRVSIFQQFVMNDRARLGLSANSHRGFDGRRVAAAATIRRGHVADDGFATLNGLGSQLKERLAIRFIDQYGQEEAGIDGGGLFKEFLTSLSKEAFDIDRGLWLENEAHELYPASTSYSRDPFSLQWYAFLGRVMGKALYEGILVDVPFAPFFLSKWLGRASGFDDLASFDPELYRGLVQLKNYPGSVEKDMSLNFAVTDDDFGVSRTIELVPNGSNVAVTNENRISYIYRISDYRLNKQIERQCSAFFSGLSDLIDPKWLRMFNQVELGLLVGGAETAIDIDDLRHNTVYSRGFDESHPSIQYFWKVVNDFSQNDKKALIKFATSCPRPPLLGFGQLNPKFAIGNGGSDESRLPSASTCVNLLKLPTYSHPETLKAKLRASINSGAGFDLS